MKCSGLLIILGLSCLSLAPIAEAINNTYQCIAETETTVGYDPASNKVKAEAGKV
jgi:hypothetical protein